MGWVKLSLLVALCATSVLTSAIPAAHEEPVAAPAPAPATPGEEAGRGLGQHSRNSIQTGDSLMDAIYNDCLRKDSVSCVKYKLFSFVDKVLATKDSFSLTEGVTVVKTPGAADGGPRAMDTPEDADVETMLVGRVERFLRTHTVKIDLNGNDVLNAVSNAGRALGDAADGLGLGDDDAAGDEARGKKSEYTSKPSSTFYTIHTSWT